MDCSPPGFPVLHYLLEFAQSHVHRVDDLETKQQQKQRDISKDYPDDLIHFHEFSFGL